MRHYVLIGLATFVFAVVLSLMTSFWDRSEQQRLEAKWMTRERLLDRRPAERRRQDILRRRSRARGLYRLWLRGHSVARRFARR
jgi:hypothetical protein